jgi:hypothetical protein
MVDRTVDDLMKMKSSNTPSNPGASLERGVTACFVRKIRQVSS